MLGCLEKDQEMIWIKAAQEVQMKLMEVWFQEQGGL